MIPLDSFVLVSSCFACCLFFSSSVYFSISLLGSSSANTSSQPYETSLDHHNPLMSLSVVLPPKDHIPEADADGDATSSPHISLSVVVSKVKTPQVPSRNANANATTYDNRQARPVSPSQRKRQHSSSSVANTDTNTDASNNAGAVLPGHASLFNSRRQHEGGDPDAAFPWVRSLFDTSNSHSSTSTSSTSKSLRNRTSGASAQPAAAASVFSSPAPRATGPESLSSFVPYYNGEAVPRADPIFHVPLAAHEIESVATAAAAADSSLNSRRGPPMLTDDHSTFPHRSYIPRRSSSPRRREYEFVHQNDHFIHCTTTMPSSHNFSESYVPPSVFEFSNDHRPPPPMYSPHRQPITHDASTPSTIAMGGMSSQHSYFDHPFSLHSNQNYSNLSSARDFTNWPPHTDAARAAYDTYDSVHSRDGMYPSVCTDTHLTQPINSNVGLLPAAEHMSHGMSPLGNSPSVPHGTHDFGALAWNDCFEKLPPHYRSATFPYGGPKDDPFLSAGDYGFGEFPLTKPVPRGTRSHYFLVLSCVRQRP